jgi:flagellar biosynthetic protein FliR
VTQLAGLLWADASLFALVASRIAGFVVASPFPGRNVGVTQRVGLVVVLTWLTIGNAPRDGVAGAALDLALGGRAVLEVACGIVIGMVFRFTFAAAEILAGALSQATGLSSASVFNPAMDAPETAIERIVSLAAMALALAMGVHRVALAALLGSFHALPVGSPLALQAPVFAGAELGIRAFVLGVRLATPVLAVALLVQIALALVSRAAPTLQIFSVGFTVLFTSTLATLMASLGDVASGLGSHFDQLASMLDLAITAMRR